MHLVMLPRNLKAFYPENFPVLENLKLQVPGVTMDWHMRLSIIVLLYTVYFNNVSQLGTLTIS